MNVAMETPLVRAESRQTHKAEISLVAEIAVGFLLSGKPAMH
jgi:hypothetical protein